MVVEWSTFLSAMTLALVRVSGMVVFAPFFSSNALPVRTKAVLVLAIAYLLAPLVATLPNARRRSAFPRCWVRWQWGWSTASRWPC